MPYLLILTTTSTKKQAVQLSETILSARLAACVNISSPVDSVYWWKGKKEKAKEVQVWIKTKSSAYKRLERILLENHPYTVPEIIAFPVQKGSRNYLRWLDKEVKA